MVLGGLEAQEDRQGACGPLQREAGPGEAVGRCALAQGLHGAQASQPSRRHEAHDDDEAREGRHGRERGERREPRLPRHPVLRLEAPSQPVQQRVGGADADGGRERNGDDVGDDERAQDPGAGVPGGPQYPDGGQVGVDEVAHDEVGDDGSHHQDDARQGDEDAHDDGRGGPHGLAREVKVHDLQECEGAVLLRGPHLGGCLLQGLGPLCRCGGADLDDGARCEARVLERDVGLVVQTDGGSPQPRCAPARVQAREKTLDVEGALPDGGGDRDRVAQPVPA